MTLYRIKKEFQKEYKASIRHSIFKRVDTQLVSGTYIHTYAPVVAMSGTIEDNGMVFKKVVADMSEKFPDLFQEVEEM